MKLRLTVATLAAALTAAAPGIVDAQAPAWPCPTVKYIVGFAAGGTTDLIARMLQPGLQKALGVGIVIENHPGAGFFPSRAGGDIAQCTRGQPEPAGQ